LENKIARLEKIIKDKDGLIHEITKNLNNAEGDISKFKKEKEQAVSAKTAAEARLRVVQNTIKAHEKEREKLNEHIQDKEKQISKLESDNRTLREHLQIEKDNATAKLDQINTSLKDFSKSNTSKDAEIESLKKARAEYQAECQDLVKQIFDKDKEISFLKSEKEILEKKFVELEQSFDNMYRKRIEENFSNVVAYIEEKEQEVDQLRKALTDKETESSFMSMSEGRKLKEMEAVMLNLARELRLKEEENEELRKFVDKYREMLNELHRVQTEREMTSGGR